jgi:hypothetical protein
MHIKKFAKPKEAFMRSKLWNVGILGAVLVFVLLMAGCKQEADDDPSIPIPPAVGLGKISAYDEQVYLFPDFSEMDTTTKVYAMVGGSGGEAGTMTSGKLSFSVSWVPKSLGNWMLDGTSISPANVNVGRLVPSIGTVTGTDLTTSHTLWQYDFSKTDFDSTVLTYKIFEYWYADNDAQITGIAKGPTSTRTYSLALKKGWNSVMWTQTDNYSSNDDFLNSTVSITAGTVSAGALWFAEEQSSNANVQASRMSFQQSLHPAFAPSHR